MEYIKAEGIHLFTPGNWQQLLLVSTSIVLFALFLHWVTFFSD
jgi:hypothetical protein